MPSETSLTKTGPKGPAARNIEAVAQLEQEFLHQRSVSDRISDAIASFVGSIPLVAIHVAWFAAWVTINLKLIPRIAAFDPYPYQLLCMLVSLGGVLLSTFVLIKQNRMCQRADQRSHLDLQVNLLSEKEVTKLMQMQQLVCQKLGIDETERDSEIAELSEITAVDDLAHELKNKIKE